MVQKARAAVFPSVSEAGATLTLDQYAAEAFAFKTAVADLRITAATPASPTSHTRPIFAATRACPQPTLNLGFRAPLTRPFTPTAAPTPPTTRYPAQPKLTSSPHPSPTSYSTYLRSISDEEARIFDTQSVPPSPTAATAFWTPSNPPRTLTSP